jgi:hypothetical protein
MTTPRALRACRLVHALDFGPCRAALGGVGGPIQVRLTKRRMRVRCLVTDETEVTDELDVDSMIMRGAMREITGYRLANGFRPVGQWAAEDEDGTEYVRRFRKAAKPR